MVADLVVTVTGDGNNLIDLGAQSNIERRGSIPLFSTRRSRSHANNSAREDNISYDLEYRVKFNLRVCETVAASSSRDDVISQSVLSSSILVEDGLPVWLHGAETARDDLIKERNDCLLCKVLGLVYEKLVSGALPYRTA